MLSMVHKNGEGKRLYIYIVFIVFVEDWKHIEIWFRYQDWKVYTTSFAVTLVQHPYFMVDAKLIH